MARRGAAPSVLGWVALLVLTMLHAAAAGDGAHARVFLYGGLRAGAVWRHSGAGRRSLPFTQCAAEGAAAGASARLHELVLDGGDGDDRGAGRGGRAGVDVIVVELHSGGLGGAPAAAQHTVSVVCANVTLHLERAADGAAVAWRVPERARVCEREMAVVVDAAPGSRGPTVSVVPLQSTLKPATWMQQLGSLSNATGALGSLTLAQIALPGTHDSGTFALTLAPVEPPDAFVAVMEEVCAVLEAHGAQLNCSRPERVAELFSYPWSVTQTGGWRAQLESGARSIDYRGYYNATTGMWVAQHSLQANASTTPEALGGAVRQFLDANAGELVIIEYSNYGAGDPADLLARLQRALGGYAYAWQSGVVIPGDPPLHAMLASGARAVLVAANGGQRAPVTVGIVNDYPNSCDSNEAVDYDATAIELFANEKADAMRKLGWQVTPQPPCIVANVALGALGRRGACLPVDHMTCSEDLLGLVAQLNARFSLSYVLNTYVGVTPLHRASYFGNVWNVDAVQWRLVEPVPALDAILLANAAHAGAPLRCVAA